MGVAIHNLESSPGLCALLMLWGLGGEADTQRHLLVFLRGRERIGRTDGRKHEREMIAIVAVVGALAGVILTS